MELSKAEYRVAEQVARGYSEKEIADRLFLSYRTIRTHTYNIRKKWNARSAVDVARIFILRLEDPKTFFASLVFLLIQLHITFTTPQVELRKTARTSIRVKTAKRRIEAYEI